MKKIHQYLSTAFLILLSGWTTAQYSITPGVGFNNIQIGMQVSNLIEILGEPESVVTREAEKTSWEESGYNTAKEFPFQIAFDLVYSFPSNVYLLWKVHTDQGKIVYINIASYQEDTSAAMKIDVLGRIHFYDTWGSVQKKMGANYIKRERDGGNIQYMYLEKGISFNVDEGVIRNIYLYAPVDPKTAKKLSKKLRN